MRFVTFAFEACEEYEFGTYIFSIRYCVQHSSRIMELKEVLIAAAGICGRSPVSAMNLGGYLVAFLAVCVYNYQKLRSMNASAKLKDASTAPQSRSKDEEVVGPSRNHNPI